MMKIDKNTGYWPGILLLLVFFFSICSCKEDFARLIPDVEYGEEEVDVSYGAPKVLYLIVDGARGESVRAANAPNLTGLLNHSIYSWVSLSEVETASETTNWADMLTGVRKNKHGVLNQDLDGNNLEDFPLLYKRIHDAYPEGTMVAYTSSESFKENFTEGTQHSELLANDEAVKDQLLTSLGDKDVTLVVGHFRGIEEAGNTFGFDNSFPEYKQSILQFDEYVGELLKAMEARTDFEKEDWLVVIASSSGGDFTIPENQNDNTVFSIPGVNTFTIFYAPKYQSRFINKPYLGNRFQGDFVRFQGERYAEINAGDNALYNFGEEAFTIELKIKKNRGSNNNYKYYYPSLIGKRPEWSSGWPANGWVIFLEDNFWMFNARGTGDGNQVRGGTLSDATWNNITVVGVLRDNERFLRTYTNGQFNNESNITSWGNLDTDALLKMGYINGNGHGSADVYLADIRIWKVALPDDIIKSYSCEVGVDEFHPYFDFLAGYWPIIGSDGNTIIDEGPFGSHMALKGGDYSIDRLAEYLCAPSTDDIGALVPRSVDIPAQIVSWLKIPRQENWQFDGRVWLDR